MRGLTIELPSPGLATLRAVEHFLREPRLQARVRVTRAPRVAPEPGVLRIESASLVRPVVTVLWGDERSVEVSSNDLSVALSREIWTDHLTPEPWRVTAEPLPQRGRLGTPDLHRPWVLIAPGVSSSAAQVSALTGLDEPQLHFIGSGWASGDSRSVRWLPAPGVVRALLGHVDAVIAAPGPLAWDAQRAGVPVFEPASSSGVPSELAARRLTRTVPAMLVYDPNFWRKLAGDVLGGAESTRWGTIAWLLHARERVTAPPKPGSSSSTGVLRVKKKLRKLRRDPAAFWADSAIARLISKKERLP